MTDLQNNESGSQQLPATDKENADIYEDEINLANYVLALWKRKYLILLGSLIPTLIVWLSLFLFPKSYKVSYIYVGEFKQQDHKTLLDQFYSAENISRIRAKLPAYNPQMISFKTWPPFPTLSGSITKNPVLLEESSQIKAQLLYLSVVGRDRSDILKFASVIRDNFEYIMPLYFNHVRHLEKCR